MREEYLLALLMLGVVAVVEIITRNHPKWWAPALLLAAVAGSLAAGMGLRFREIVEGPFGFLDALLPCVVGMIFLRVLKDNGAWDALFSRLVGKTPILSSFGALLFLALPGMLTGFAAASVLMSARPVYEHLLKRGAPKAKAVGFVAVGAFLGMMLPLAVVLALVLVEGLLGSYVYVGGQVIIFLVGLVLAFLLPAERRGLKAALDTVLQGTADMAIPAAAVLALGSFIEVSSMNGIRGIFSYHILPWTNGDLTYGVMLVLMALSLAVGFFLSAPLPAFFITYAVFPIGWLANTVIVTGCAAAVGVVCLVAFRGGVFSRTKEELGIEDVTYKQVLPQLLLPALLVTVLGIVMVVFGDKMTGLIL